MFSPFPPSSVSSVLPSFLLALPFLCMYDIYVCAFGSRKTTSGIGSPPPSCLRQSSWPLDLYGFPCLPPVSAQEFWDYRCEPPRPACTAILFPTEPSSQHCLVTFGTGSHSATQTGFKFHNTSALALPRAGIITTVAVPPSRLLHFHPGERVFSFWAW